MTQSRSDSLPPTPVRRSISTLIPELQHITIDADALSDLASTIASEDFPLPEWRAPVFPNERRSSVSAADVLNFLFVGNTINFQFRDYGTGEKFAAHYNGTEWRGAFGMWACLKREFDENPAILSGSTLANLSRPEVNRLFTASNGIDMPMLDERHRILTQIGQRLDDQYSGEFANFVAATPSRLFDDGNGLVELLVTEFPSFRDSAVVSLSDQQTVEVLFWKRAQLAPGMAYGRFGESPSFALEDPQAFSVFVDYNLPNVLRGLDILEYSDQLAHRIDRGRLLEAGGREEVELRAATVYAADRLLEELNTIRDEPICALHLDYKLFQMRDEVSTPIHRTETTAY